jgi:hypothetical protein
MKAGFWAFGSTTAITIAIVIGTAIYEANEHQRGAQEARLGGQRAESGGNALRSAWNQMTGKTISGSYRSVVALSQLNFYPDGRFDWAQPDISRPSPPDFDDPGSFLHQGGTYKIDGNRIVLTLDAAKEALRESQRTGNPLLEGLADTAGTWIAWISDDKETVTFNDIPFHRLEGEHDSGGTATPHRVARSSAPNAEIGIRYQPVLPSTAARYGIPLGRGVFVSGVVPASSADLAGIAPGDIILAVDGRTITRLDDIEAAKARHLSGRSSAPRLVFRVVRGLQGWDVAVPYGR